MPTLHAPKTVAQISATFLQVKDQAVASGRTKPATRDFYHYQFRHLLRARDSAGRSVALRDAADLIPEDLAGAPYTWHFVTAVCALFRWAHDAGHIPAFRFAGFLAPPAGQRTRTLDAGEWRRLRQSANPALRRILWFMRYTCCRPGEVRQLRWRDVHLDRRVIRLTTFKARDRRKDGVRIRTIPLVPVVVRVLRIWRKARQPLPENFVFFNSHRRPYSCQSLRKAMGRATRGAGLNADGEERVVSYTIRHTGATEATRRGIRDRTLADILGHTSTRTTARYQHLQEDDLVAAMEVVTRPRRQRKSA